MPHVFNAVRFFSNKKKMAMCMVIIMKVLSGLEFHFCAKMKTQIVYENRINHIEMIVLYSWWSHLFMLLRLRGIFLKYIHGFIQLGAAFALKTDYFAINHVFIVVKRFIYLFFLIFRFGCLIILGRQIRIKLASCFFYFVCDDFFLVQIWKKKIKLMKIYQWSHAPCLFKCFTDDWDSITHFIRTKLIILFRLSLQKPITSNVDTTRRNALYRIQSAGSCHWSDTDLPTSQINVIWAII